MEYEAACARHGITTRKAVLLGGIAGSTKGTLKFSAVHVFLLDLAERNGQDGDLGMYLFANQEL